MNKPKNVFNLTLKSLFLILILISQAFTGATNEDKLKKAIHLVNNGKNEEALLMLRELVQENPTDERVLHTLGHIYRSKGEYKEAIDIFEKAAQIKPSKVGYYSLGLLYEAMSVETPQKNDEIDWLIKAQNAWNNFLRIKDTDSRRIEVVERHLIHIKEQLKELSSK